MLKLLIENMWKFLLAVIFERFSIMDREIRYKLLLKWDGE